MGWTVATAATNGSDERVGHSGGGRGRDAGREGRGAGGREGVCGDVQSVRALRGSGRQAGWWRGELGGVAVSLLCLLARGGRRQGEAPGGLGRTGGLPAQELGRLLAPGKCSLLCFIILFSFINIFCHCFEFKQIQTMPKTPLNIFILLDGLFQKLIKYFRGI